MNSEIDLKANASVPGGDKCTFPDFCTEFTAVAKLFNEYIAVTVVPTLVFIAAALVAVPVFAAGFGGSHDEFPGPDGIASREFNRHVQAIVLAGSNVFGKKAMAKPPTPSAVPDSFFGMLRRSGKPNSWLIAPAGFALAADGPSPVFDVPMTILKEAFTSVALANGRAKMLESSEHAMHILDTTAVMGFKDDVHIQFISINERQSTLAAYSESQVGYWDFGKNRRRIEEWVRETQSRLAAEAR